MLAPPSEPPIGKVSESVVSSAEQARRSNEALLLAAMKQTEGVFAKWDEILKSKDSARLKKFVEMFPEFLGGIPIDILNKIQEIAASKSMLNKTQKIATSERV